MASSKSPALSGSIVIVIKSVRSILLTRLFLRTDLYLLRSSSLIVTLAKSFNLYLPVTNKKSLSMLSFLEISDTILAYAVL